MAETIYAALAQLDPEEVKASVDPELSKAGMRYYERQNFSHYEWIEPALHVRCIVDLTGVEFWWEQGDQLGTRCKCSGETNTPCAHILAGLFTFYNLMDDSRLTVFFRDNKEHELVNNWFWSQFRESGCRP